MLGEHALDRDRVRRVLLDPGVDLRRDGEQTLVDVGTGSRPRHPDRDEPHLPSREAVDDTETASGQAWVDSEDTHAVSPEDFDRAWRNIDGTGWAYLKDCTNGSLEKRDPVYVFDVKDDEQKNSFQCQTREVPYPYNDITDPLDVLAQQGQKQLGDDEPADAKALDKKDMQR